MSPFAGTQGSRELGALMDVDEIGFGCLAGHVWRGANGQSTRNVLSTGFPALDSRLPGGGWPRGAIIEIFVGRYGIGELTVLIPALATLTRPVPGDWRFGEAQKWVAWIAPPFIPYAPALTQRGVQIERLLMIHPSAGRKDRLWAIEQVVRSGSSTGVLAWLAEADDVALRRLQLAAEEHECWTVLFRPLEALQNRSPAALRIRVAQLSAGIRVEVVKCRGGRPCTIDIADYPGRAGSG
jgi:cell division inhibitor SulA/protein ImuA